MATEAQTDAARAGDRSGLQLKLFGGFRLDCDQRPVKLPTRKTEALLAYLALEAGRPLDREGLLRLFWPDRHPEQARNSLRQALTGLRQALHGTGAKSLLVSDRTSVALSLDQIEVDAIAFEQHLAENTRASLLAAIALYDGELLAGYGQFAPEFATWRSEQAARFRGLAKAALGELIASIEDAASDDARELASRLLMLDPRHEPAHRVLAAHYHATRQPARAAAQLALSREAAGAGHGGAALRNLDETRRSVPTRRLDSAELSNGGRAIVPALPDRPSLAVLPFRDLSPDDNGYFVDGIVEELISAISHVRWLFVIARGSTFAYKGRDVDVREIGRTVGVRYILEGSVRRAGERVRITGQLVEAETAVTLWAEHIDGSISDVFDMQNRVAEAVTGAVAPRIEAAEIARSRRKPPDDLDAWDLYLRALPHVHAMRREDHELALELLRQSAAHDPTYVAPLALSCWLYVLRVAQRWGEPEVNVKTGLELAERALALNQNDAETLLMAGYGKAFLGRDYDAGLFAIDRGLSVNTNSAWGFTSSGWVRSYRGDHTTAEEHFRRALRLSPLDPLTFRTRAGLAFALLFQGRFDEAAAEAQAAANQNPNFSPAHRVIAVAHAHAGRIEKARSAAASLHRIIPDVSVQGEVSESRFRLPEDRAILGRGLLRAGLPE